MRRSREGLPSRVKVSLTSMKPSVGYDRTYSLTLRVRREEMAKEIKKNGREE